MPPPKSINKVLQDSPMLNTEEVKRLFPTKEERDALLAMARALHAAVEENAAAAAKWKKMTAYKETALVLLERALGVVL